MLVRTSLYTLLSIILVLIGSALFWHFSALGAEEYPAQLHDRAAISFRSVHADTICLPPTASDKMNCEKPAAPVNGLKGAALDSKNDSAMPKNIFGQDLIPCCYEPLTGFYRDGFCRTDVYDSGRHVVCAIMTEEFLEFTKGRGNDLSTPIPAYQFPGLKPGDKWCLCALRWREAYEHGVAPKLVLEACAEEALRYVDLDVLVQFAQKEK